jgi:hypothetical protein
MQYTLRNVSRDVDKILRRRAKEEGKSLNEVALEAMSRGLDIEPKAGKFQDLDFAIGTWVEDPEFDKAVENQRQIDPEMWK